MTAYMLIAGVLIFGVGLACGVLCCFVYAVWVLGVQAIEQRRRAVQAAQELEQAIARATQARPN